MDNQNNFSGFAVFLAALGGAVVGAGVALLLAPASGHDARARIVGVAGDARDVVGRVPEALKAASHAAREAMVHDSEPPPHPGRHAAKA